MQQKDFRNEKNVCSKPGTDPIIDGSKSNPGADVDITLGMADAAPNVGFDVIGGAVDDDVPTGL